MEFSVNPATRMRRVLVVAYVFPPSGGAGVQRVTKFVKHLPEFGWDCSVLTVANPSVPVCDETLAEDVPEATEIRKARTYEPGYALKNIVSAGAASGNAATSKWSVRGAVKKVVRSVGNAVLQPDAQILWYPQAVREGMRLLNELHHDAIFVTAPPFSSFVTASELSRRSGLPLIVDYRDEWGISNQYQENRQKSRLSHRLQSRMQRRVLRQAASVIATTRRSADSLAELVKQVDSQAEVSHIYNGFDRDDLPSLGHESRPDDDKLRLAYVGTLWNLTSIEPVVQAIRQVATQHPQLAARIELTVAGRRTADQEAILDRLSETPCQLIREGYVDHSRAIQIMSNADELCLLLSGVPEAGRVVPAKTFEYLALDRSILAVVPNGEVDEILSDCPRATVKLPEDVTGIANYLVQRLEQPADSRRSWPLSTSAAGPIDAQQFERRELTRQLAETIDRVVGVTRSSDVLASIEVADEVAVAE